MTSQQDIIAKVCTGSLTDFEILQNVLTLAIPTIFFVVAVIYIVLILWFLVSGFKNSEGKYKSNLFQPNVLLAILFSFLIAISLIFLTKYVPFITEILNKIFL